MSPALVMMLLAAAAPDGAPAPFDLAGRTVLLHVQAAGAQVYECKATAGQAPAWVFREPIATLVKDGKTVGRHYAGPSWALDDGSVVAGKMAASIPGATPADIPQLKLDVVRHAGQGMLDQAQAVYRIRTEGGQLSGACGTPGDLRAVPYRADYVFAR